MAQFCMIQSFNHEVLRHFEQINYKELCCNQIKTLYIHNFYYDHPIKYSDEEIKDGSKLGTGSHM